jgi:hypothetical protein
MRPGASSRRAQSGRVSGPPWERDEDRGALEREEEEREAEWEREGAEQYDG